MGRRVQPTRENKVRSMTLLATALMLGLGGCVTKLVDENCQNRGFSPGSPQYDACYPYSSQQLVRTYQGAIQAALQWPYVPPPAIAR
jgi:hypothetical protein